ncbi:MAG TPA: hypothetical protein VGN83_19390 [Falsiroseomonas sp.]|jgi:hypothetical protein|nr:hypothetical protein [Falsiroseomonas sp.]
MRTLRTASLAPAVLALLALGACGPMPPPQPSVALPASASRGAGDPLRGAILSTAYVFGQPSSVAGDPAAAAEALAQLEYLTVELAGPPGNFDMDPLVAPMMEQGRAEARTAFGFSPSVPPQRAVDALYATAGALRAGNQAAARAAIAPLAGPDQADAALQRLAALPYLPAAASATARAQSSLSRRNRDRSPPRRL